MRTLRRDDERVPAASPRVDARQFPVLVTGVYRRARKDDDPASAAPVDLARVSTEDLEALARAIPAELARRRGQAAPTAPTESNTLPVPGDVQDRGRGDSHKTEAQAIKARAERTRNAWRRR